MIWTVVCSFLSQFLWSCLRKVISSIAPIFWTSLVSWHLWSWIRNLWDVYPAILQRRFSCRCSIWIVTWNWNSQKRVCCICLFSMLTISKLLSSHSQLIPQHSKLAFSFFATWASISVASRKATHIESNEYLYCSHHIISHRLHTRWLLVWLILLREWIMEVFCLYSVFR